MQNQGANLWSVHTCSNHYFMHEGGENIRRKALEKGIFEDISVKLGLIYSAFFGFKVLHKLELYTPFWTGER